MNSIEVRNIEPAEADAYLAFARRCYGAGAYQGSRAWLRWQYEDNPYSRGLKDLWIARSGADIVGCFHLLRLTWRTSQGTFKVASFNNLMVEEKHRGGLGVRLIRKALAAEKIALLAGSTPQADAIYARLGCADLGCQWLWKMVSIANILMPTRHQGKATGAAPAGSGAELGPPWREYRSYATESPGDQAIDEVLHLHEKSAGWVQWDRAGFRWRYFHPGGPKTNLVRVELNSRLAGYAVVSPFQRRRIPCAGLLEFQAENPMAADALLRATEACCKRSGAALGLVATTDPHVVSCLRRARWRNRRNPPGCRIHQSRELAAVVAPPLLGGAWDFGFSF
ncbi:MAG TPA: GNAT family N-acetyltransferase [Lacunisphaera sp.]|nr:GNAT family N-acetyltransferase [Lacunisphaera sp.]